MLTIIILTRNRTQWLHKALSKYSSLNYEGTVHIEDDSTDEFFEKNKEISEHYKKELDIKHFKGAGYKEDTQTKRMIATTRKCLDRVKTKYYSFTSDDDFFSLVF